VVMESHVQDSAHTLWDLGGNESARLCLQDFWEKIKHARDGARHRR
jgi:hypothetical protein